jgi:CRISPR-associated protein Cmr4
MAAYLTFVHALSPLHAGTGQGVGVIDLPVAREKATNIPFLPGSSLKGTLRSLSPENARKNIYGPEPTDADPEGYSASPVQFSDQRLLLLPVRSLAGTFAWVTSPYVLRRLKRDMEDIQKKTLAYVIPEISDENSCLMASENPAITTDAKVYLEDLDLNPTHNADLNTWATWIAGQVFSAGTESDWRDFLVQRFCLVHDDAFSFLIENATEITARVKLLENSKTVKRGGLWYEEALPAETILSGIMLATPIGTSGKTAKEIVASVKNDAGKAVQLGGKATVGRGLCRVIIAEEA